MSSPPNVTLRRAEPGDAAAVQRLVRAAYDKWVALIGREPKPMTADYQQAIGRHLVYLLETSEGLQGVLELIREPDCLLVENVAVDPRAQGRGYGRALMAEAEWIAWDIEARQMRLYTNERFAANIALYERIGYRIFQRSPIADGYMVWMQKTVEAGS